MPQKRASAPPPVMTWSKASPVLFIAIIFDALRIIFEWFWFFGPALAVVACTAGVNSAIGATLAGAVGKAVAAVCGVAAGAAGFFGAPAIEAFGVVMAMAVGFLGWLTVGFIILSTNSRILKANAGHALWLVGSLLISEIPIVGTFPALTTATWKIYAAQIRDDGEALKKFEAAQATEQVQERRRQEAGRIEQLQIEQAEQEEAENQTASNDEEIPDDVRMAA
jgi:hypothetical protein